MNQLKIIANENSTVKRKLKSAGFEVISLDGPPGKRQMIKANKKSIL